MSESGTTPWLVDPTVFASTQFDYLVVGGGTAGLTLASRLAEDSQYKIGVIEGGSYLPNDPMINDPAKWFKTLADTSYSWQLATTPQEHGHGREIYLPSGKVLGGSSAINLMAFMRASKSEYDNWEKLGNSGWNWEGLLPYFRKTENFVTQKREVVFPGADKTDQAGNLEGVFHGSQGPLKITYNNTYDSLLHPAVKSMNALGIPTNRNPYFGNATGVFNIASTVDRLNGTRSYSANTYLASARGQNNILVVPQAQASRIVWSKGVNSEDDELTATGVEFVSDGRSFTANATQEVILSAGTFKTPQILELSGIGDEKRLSAHGISCVIDLPQVGENYQDHLGVFSMFDINPDPPKPEEGSGNNAPLSEDPTRTLSAFSFFPLKNIVPADVLGKMVDQLDISFRATSSTPLQKAQFFLQRDSIYTDVGNAELLVAGASPSPHDPGEPYMIIMSCLQHPYSRGHIHIQSNDPLAKPAIDARFLESAFDLEVLAKITRFSRTVSETEPLKSALLGPALPPSSVQTDEEFEDFVRQAFQTVYHPVGTAAMAPRELGGVVDPSLLVYGTRNVRVVDASVIPLHIGAHIQATVYAIAEKAADIIKSSH